MVGDSRTHNLLIVSDLHLGADLKRSGFAWLRGVATLDREFGAFLDWYAAHRESGKPWRLIVNGDMVDFINVTMVPEPDDTEAGFRVSDAERRYGLDGEEAKVAWVLGRVVERHRALFEKLSAFVDDGNELVIVRGNHDVEFHWPLVQDRFRDLLSSMCEGKEDVAARIRFLPWFYYEPGSIFVEHGHQYDEYSSFEYLLAPVAPEAPARVDLPLSHFAIRYLANAFPNISTHDKDGWGLLDYVRLGWTGKSGSVVGLFFGYLATLRHVGASVLLRKLDRKQAARLAHAGHLQRLAKQCALPAELLGRLELLHRGGALRSAFRAAQCYYADRFALFGFCAVLLLLLTDIGLPATVMLAAMVGCVLFAAGVNRVLEKARNAEIHPKLATAGRAVAVLLNVPLVVMGHSHKPAQVSEILAGEADAPAGIARYVNTGTWIPAKDNVGFTHLMVRRGDGAAQEAELRRWSAPDRKPLEYS